MVLEKEPPRPAGTPPEEGNLRSLVWEGSFRSTVLGEEFTLDELRGEFTLVGFVMGCQGLHRWGNSSREGTTPPYGHPSRGGEFTLARLGGEFTRDGLGGEFKPKDWMCFLNFY
jgi:hypothetical protein